MGDAENQTPLGARAGWGVFTKRDGVVLWATVELLQASGPPELAFATTDLEERLVFDNLGAAETTATELSKSMGLRWEATTI